jgi:hypothetical protein
MVEPFGQEDVVQSMALRARRAQTLDGADRFAGCTRAPSWRPIAL